MWSKTHYDCSTIVMLLRGFAKGVPTKHLTDEMDLAYPSVLKRRHRIQEAVQQGKRVGLPGGAPEDGLPDPEVEADEMYQNAGKKGKPHRNPGDPTRSRANKARGRGTYENDRPPVLGMIGRETGWACFRVCVDTKEETIRKAVAGETAEEACIFTDENRSYLWLESKEESRTRSAIDHSEGWATGQDGDGIREVHVRATRRNLDKPAQPTAALPRSSQGPPIRIRSDV